MNTLDTKKLNKAQKLLLIFQRITQPQGVFAESLREEFDLDDRTFRRYLKDLSDINIPIKKSKEENDIGDKEQKLSLPPDFQRGNVQISLTEWISLRFGRNLFSFLDGTTFSEDLDEALENISHVTANKTIELTKNIDQKFLNIPESTKDHTTHSETIDEIITALLYQHEVEAFYSKIASPMKKYTLHPYTLVTYRQGLYLFAYDVDAEIVKTFAVERFQKFTRRSALKNRKFSIRPDYDPQKMIENSFGIIRGSEPQEIVLKFARKTAPYIQERTWHRSQQLQVAPGGELILKMKVGITHELRSWLLSFGNQVKILAPQELAEDIRDAHRKAAEE